MSTLAKTPSTKTKPALSLFTGASGSPEESPAVLLRVRDLSPPEEAQQDIAKPEAAKPQAGETTLEAIKVDSTLEQTLAGEAAAASAPASVTASQLDPPLASPARRQRPERQAQPARRYWQPSLWQGIVGLVLVALCVTICFIIWGGDKSKATAGPANDAAQQSDPASDDLQPPEISIPEVGMSASEMMEMASSRTDTDPLAEFSAEPRKSAQHEFKREREDADRGDRSTFSQPQEYVERPAMREVSKSRTQSGTYPVTPAQATYPVTDPGRFRYPDDSRASDASGRSTSLR